MIIYTLFLVHVRLQEEISSMNLKIQQLQNEFDEMHLNQSKIEANKRDMKNRDLIQKEMENKHRVGFFNF